MTAPAVRVLRQPVRGALGWCVQARGQAPRELAQAIDEGAWPRALELALAAWRGSRDPRLADVVDRISARCELPSPPAGGGHHAWWIERARPYEPVVAGALIEQLLTRVRGSDVSWEEIAARWPGGPVVRAAGEPIAAGGFNGIDRLSALVAWPDDPRVARALASWLLTDVPYLERRRQDMERLDRVLADRIAAIGDVRLLPRLRAYLEERPPWAAPGAPPPDRAQRVPVDRRARRMQLVEEIAEALERVPPRSVEGAGELAARLAEPTELERLWARVGEPSDDLGARSVLADALIAAGDRRGMLISLQLAAAREPLHGEREQRLKWLIADEWDRWMGELGAIVVRNRSTLRNGMLEVIHAGHAFTPRWLWRAVRGHRELFAVQTVHPATVDAEDYAAFVAGLPNLRTLVLQQRETVRALAALGARLPIARLEYHPQGRPPGGQHALSLRTMFELLARIAPDLREIWLPPEPVLEEGLEVLAALPSLFRLEAVEIASSFAAYLRGFEGMPFVKLVKL